MPGSKKQLMSERLHVAHKVFSNARNSLEIREVLEGYRFGEERFKRAWELYHRVEKLDTGYSLIQAGKLKATTVLGNKLKKAKKPYMEFLQIARLVFKNNPGAIQILGLKGRRSPDLASWLDEARQFYTNALSEPKILEQLCGYGIDKKRLEAGKKLLEEVEQAAADQERKKGKLLQATLDRKQAFKEMDQTVSIIKRLATLGLLKGPREQLLEQLGIVVPS